MDVNEPVAQIATGAKLPMNAEDQDQVMYDATPEVPQPIPNAEKRSKGEANEASSEEMGAIKLEELFDMDEDDDEEFPGSAPPLPSIP